jgi:hypothetical protein
MRAHGFETDIIYAGGRASDILIPEGMEHEACRGSHLLDALLLVALLLTASITSAPNIIAAGDPFQEMCLFTQQLRGH